MKNIYRFSIVLSLIAISFASIYAQESNIKKPLRKVVEKTLEYDFGSGGTVSITASKHGSISVEGWNKQEVEVVTEVVVEATNAQDLNTIAAVCGSTVEDSMSHLRINSVGTDDKKYLKKVDKKFPKRLRKAPYAVNYRIKVPPYTNLVITGGKGDLNISNVEGNFRINYLDSNAKLNLLGGTVLATIGTGNIDIGMIYRSWRGGFLDVSLGKGNINLELPMNMSANIDAKISHSGKIDNQYRGLKPRKRTKPTDTALIGVAGYGGAPFAFKIGDGNLVIVEKETKMLTEEKVD